MKKISGDGLAEDAARRVRPGGERVACVPVERDGREPRPPARGPARGRAAGMRIGSTDEQRARCRPPWSWLSTVSSHLIIFREHFGRKCMLVFLKHQESPEIQHMVACGTIMKNLVSIGAKSFCEIDQCSNNDLPTPICKFIGHEIPA